MTNRKVLHISDDPRWVDVELQKPDYWPEAIVFLAATVFGCVSVGGYSHN